MKRSSLIIVLLAAYTAATSQQIDSKECESLRTGTFYFYPANSGKAFQINRGYFVQAEIDLSKKDSSFWRLDWDANCVYRQHYISRTNPISREDSIYYHSHFAVCQVLAVSKDYYTFKVGVDSLKHHG